MFQVFYFMVDFLLAQVAWEGTQKNRGGAGQAVSGQEGLEHQLQYTAAPSSKPYQVAKCDKLPLEMSVLATNFSNYFLEIVCFRVIN